MRFSEFLSAILGGLAGGGAIAWFQFWQADDASYLDIVQSRVATCFATADHHRLQHKRDLVHGAKEKVDLVLIDEKGPLSEADSENDYETSNYDRFLASVLMGRELDVCLARHTNTNMDELRTCVTSATFGQDNKRVLDNIGIFDASGKSQGRWNPAC